jgi:hypothetical protein
MGILKLIKESDIIKSYKISDYRKANDRYYLKMEIKFHDDSVLCVKEYFCDPKRNYSFHWMDSANNLIIRWDNSKHHQEVITFPHHKHIEKRIEESFEICLEEVLKYIKNKMILNL